MVIKNNLDNSYWNLRNKPYSFTHILLIWMSKDNFGSMVVITWSRFGRMKFCPTLSGSRQYCKLYKFYPAITWEKFHPVRQYSSFVLPRSHLPGRNFPPMQSYHGIIQKVRSLRRGGRGHWKANKGRGRS